MLNQRMLFALFEREFYCEYINNKISDTAFVTTYPRAKTGTASLTVNRISRNLSQNIEDESLSCSNKYKKKF